LGYHFGWQEASTVGWEPLAETDIFTIDAFRRAADSWTAHNRTNCSEVEFVEGGDAKLRIRSTHQYYRDPNTGLVDVRTPAWNANYVIGPFNILGHADVYWCLDATSTNTSGQNYIPWLYANMLHEIGHTMGLDESSTPKKQASVMQGFIDGDVNDLPHRFSAMEIVRRCDDARISNGHPQYDCPIGWTPPVVTELCFQVETAKGVPVYPCDSPIVVDVDGGGYDMCDWSAGVAFDVGNDGVAELTAWTDADSTNCFLALDRNGNGKIDNGSELFGNSTSQPVVEGQSPNGFIALSMFDAPSLSGNNDGQITSADAVYSQLRLWRDSNHNGVTNAGELFTLQQKAITAISLSYWDSPRVDAFQNYFHYASIAVIGGQARKVYDVYFMSAQGV
jgi:hypothetical protein